VGSLLLQLGNAKRRSWGSYNR